MVFGIPPLLGKVAKAGNVVTLLVADAKRILSLFNSKPQWGLYAKGKAVIVADSVVSMEAKNDWRIADYPMEEGAFQSYNKVREPREVKIRLNKGGNDAARTKFLQTVNSISKSLDVYDVYMPEGKIPNVTIKHYDYKRTATEGVGLITVDLWMVEVITTVASAFSNTKDPSGSAQINVGTVQAAGGTPGQIAALTSVPAGGGF